MHHRRTLLANLLLVTTTFALPPADIGVEWAPTGDVRVLVVGDLTSDAGYEFVGINPILRVRLYSATSSSALGDLPQPFRDGNSQFTVRDLDDDGLGELVGWKDAGGQSYTLGVIDFNPSPTLLWSTTIPAPNGLSLDFLQLNGDEPQALLLHDEVGITILSPLSGVELYDSTEDPGIQSVWRLATYLIDDFDDDGYEEILAEAQNNNQPSIYRSFLIGDRAAAPTASDVFGGTRISLKQNWPNPSSGSTTIAFELGRPGRVQLRIYDVAGRLVRTLFDGGQSAGAHRLLWDGKDDGDAPVASGIYYYELNVDGKRESRKLVQLR